MKMDIFNEKLRSQLYGSLFLHNHDAVILMDCEGQFTDANPAMSRLTGYSVEELKQLTLSKFILPEGLSQEQNILDKLIRGERISCKLMICRGKTISNREVDFTVSPLYINNEMIGFQGIVKDVASMRRIECEDTLTGLPNRDSFQAQVKNVIEKAAERNERFGILFIDIDRFQSINETFGHTIGDIFLRMVGKRMSECLGSNGFLARFSGDEFTVLVRRVSDEDEVLSIAKQLMHAFRNPVMVNGFEINVTISIGAGMFPSCGEDKISLMKNTNIALHSAKKMGKNRVQLYEPWMDKDTYSRFVLASEFHRALMMNEFILHYQPRLNILTNTIDCFEALIRWNHPKRGIIYPNEFIPLAEETGFILALGEWVLNEACRQCAVWREQGLIPIRVAVNVSAHQFVQDDFFQQINKNLIKHKLDPQWLEIEITESVLMHSLERNIKVLSKIQDLGVQVSIDDFGTGYSSLNYLKKFKVNTLKIDKSFIQDLPDDIITKMIIQLAHGLGLTVVAEGVEQSEQLEYLGEHGCEQAQGFYIGKPMPPEQCIEFMEERKWIL
ncbi:sensor domain-containing protein [Paenibacillus odorifer]|nr:GGDEF domain-containing phosphodiesterase [Paenibacillus odorifer]